MTEPQNIEALKGQMLLTLAGLKTRFIGFPDVPVVAGQLHYLASEFTDANGATVTHRIPVIIDKVFPNKPRGELTPTELLEAGYRSHDDLNNRVTLDNKYEAKLRAHYSAGPYGYEHSTEELDRYPTQMFTYHVPKTHLELKRVGLSLDATMKELKGTVDALKAVEGQNSMPASIAFARETAGVNHIWTDIATRIGSLRADRPLASDPFARRA